MVELQDKCLFFLPNPDIFVLVIIEFFLLVQRKGSLNFKILQNQGKFVYFVSMYVVLILKLGLAKIDFSKSLFYIVPNKKNVAKCFFILERFP